MLQYILVISIYIDMTNQENTPTVVVDVDDKKEEPKKDDSSKTNK